MTVCGARLFVISTDKKLAEAAAAQSTRKFSVAAVRGTVYDCLGRPLTDTSEKPITVIMPTEQGFKAAAKLISDDKLADAYKKLGNGNPVVLDTECPLGLAGTVCFHVPIRYSGTLRHVLGCLDGTSHGVSGIEKYFDDILFPEHNLGITYKVSSSGRILAGDGWKITPAGGTGSVTLTVDADVQRITEDAMDGVDAGAAVIIDAASGAVRAMVSRPLFDQNNVAGSVSDEKSAPLINRALFAYNVGSVFKPCVAAAAIETGNADYTYTCEGSFEHSGLTFRCNSRSGHGTLGLGEALEKSCNTYFYTLALKIGAEKIYDYANSFKFGSALSLGGGIVSQSGSLPYKDTLSGQTAALVNLSIGQGDLLLSPTAISCMYAAIVNGGSYYSPYIVEKWEKNGEVTCREHLPAITALKKTTADLLAQYLEGALKDGTGKAAYVEGVTAGGKTGTAQTGWKDGDHNILNGWFCGFLKGAQTDYVCVILKEDVKSGSADCAPVFKEITEKLTEMGK